MKTIDDVLKQAYHQADDVNVSVKLSVSLGALREHYATLSALGIDTVSVKGSAAPSKKRRTKVAKKTRKAASASGTKRKTKAKAKTKVKAKSKAKAKATGRTAKKSAAKITATRTSTAKPGRVTQQGVFSALRKRHATPKAIATALKADQRQVSKALSRYTKQGTVVRTAPGRYALA